MSALPTHKMTVAEFLPWAASQEQGRYELVRGEVVAMAPERVRHNIVKGNTYRALGDAVHRAGSPCIVFTDGITVVVDKDTSYEPDAAVQCGANVNLDSVYCDSPIIVVEVMSPSSGKTDAAGKLADYMSLPSVCHVLIADPVRMVLVHHARGDGDTIATRLCRRGEIVKLNPPGLTVAVADIFSGL